jgi:hypothetical protein
MPRVGFEPTTPELEQAKTVHALDGAATVIGLLESTRSSYFTTWVNLCFLEPIHALE